MNTPLSKAFEYNTDNDHYDIQFNSTPTKLMIAISKTTVLPNQKYEASFSLEELTSKSKWFRIFESIDEALTEMCSLFNESSFTLKEEFGMISFIFSTSLKSAEEIQLLVPEIETKQLDKFTELSTSIKQLSLSLGVLERKFHIVENTKEYKKYFTLAN